MYGIDVDLIDDWDDITTFQSRKDYMFSAESPYLYPNWPADVGYVFQLVKCQTCIEHYKLVFRNWPSPPVTNEKNCASTWEFSMSPRVLSQILNMTFDGIGIRLNGEIPTFDDCLPVSY